MRVAVLGAGHWGRHLIRNFGALGALAGFGDRDARALDQFDGQYPTVPRFAAADTLLESADVEAVAIATPAATHGALAVRALAAGKHVFVEKPLALTAAEAVAIRERLAMTDRILMVGHLLLYHPAFEALERTVGAGKLGDLRYAYSNRLSLGRIRREENSLWSFAPHDISMILHLTGELPVQVMASGSMQLNPSVADTSLSYLRFANNIEAHIFVSWLHPFKDHRLVVVGSDGMIVFNDVAAGARKLLFYPHTARWEGDAPIVEEAPAEPIAYDDDEPLRRECQHFLSCVRDGARPRSDVEEGTRVLTVLEACQRSMVSRLPVDLGPGTDFTTPAGT